MPSRVRSDSSSELPATTALTVRPIAGSSLIRSVPAPAGIIPCRRSVTPSWSNDCTTGTCRSRAADSAASPLVQRSACTTSGRSLLHRSCSGWLKAPTCLSRWESSALESDGPTYSTETPGASLARSGSDLPLRRAYTVTWWPWPARLVLISTSRASSPAVVLSVLPGTGVLCWATRAIFIGDASPR